MNEREKFILPKHKNPTSPGRISSAAYNFVPLPDAVMRAVEDAEKELPDHDTYANESYPHTGYFDVKLTTKSPLYVRAPLTRTEFDFNEQDKDLRGVEVGDQTSYKDQVKNKPDFFYTRNPEQPVIPGSSLRGMLRNILEIASYSKVKGVTDKRLFFRTVDDTVIGGYYRTRMTVGSKVEAGFLRVDNGKVIIEVCNMARVHHDTLDAQLYEGRPPNQTPYWTGHPRQWMPVWVKLSENERFVTEISSNPKEDFSEGVLVITGNISGRNPKSKEFVFLLPAVGAEQVTVSKNIIKRFHDDDQITQWQERAFPKNQPTKNCRERNGTLRTNPDNAGDPVFFLREGGELTFFGRAQMFRLPYRNRPLDLVPLELRYVKDIDFAEAMFGYVRTRDELNEFKRHGSSLPKQGSKSRAYASRIFVTDASVTDAPNGLWLSPNPRTPGILASPKPTSFQHYLTQQQPDNKRELDHYDSPPPHETVVRGHKLYWHQGDAGIDDLSDSVPSTTTQHTRFRPIKSDVSFKFRVYFENLSDEELGAMCWTLHPLGDAGKEYCHKLGMGKPFGMGAVKLEATLHLTKRDLRYRSLFDGAGWQTGSRADDGEALNVRGNLEAHVSKFERKILDSLEPLEGPCEHLSDLKRIGMLLKMMEWSESPPEGRSRTAGLGEFKDRRVLPDPSHESFASASLGKLTGYVEPKRETAPNHFSKAESDTPARVGNRTATPIPPGTDRAATDNKSRAFYGSASTTAKAKKPKMSEDKEKVVLLTEPEKGRAQVRTHDGKEISARFGSHLRVEVEARYRAIVRRENGEPLSAEVEKLI